MARTLLATFSIVFGFGLAAAAQEGPSAGATPATVPDDTHAQGDGGEGEGSVPTDGAEATDGREDVERRLASLRLERDAERVAGPSLQHAEQALVRYDARLATGDVAGATRALEIARAALVLASRQMDHAREESALQAARRMAETARSRARVAAEALAVAQQRWEARQRGGEPSDPDAAEEVRSPADTEEGP